MTIESRDLTWMKKGKLRIESKNEDVEINYKLAINQSYKKEELF